MTTLRNGPYYPLLFLFGPAQALSFCSWERVQVILILQLGITLHEKGLRGRTSAKGTGSLDFGAQEG
jgi:hypothetical protein